MIQEKTTQIFAAEKIDILAPKVSAVIITYNEEHIINKTLSRLWWCDEIIIVDSGSTDRTIEICREFGCEIYTRSFEGYGEQKKYAVARAKNDWILCIDADEVLSPELVQEIETELCNSEIAYSGFSMPMTLVYMNKPFRYGKEANASIIRLFNKNKGSWDEALVHEKLILDGEIKQLSNKILHYSYFSYSQHLQKINLYSSLGARKLLNKNKSKNKYVLALCIPFNFFKYYILDRNFLNGFNGFAWSVFNAFYHFMKYVKLYELKRISASK